MIAVRAIFDGKGFKLLEPAPSKNHAEVIITFLTSAKPANNGVDVNSKGQNHRMNYTNGIEKEGKKQGAVFKGKRAVHGTIPGGTSVTFNMSKYAGAFKGKLSRTDQFIASKKREKELDR